jgi:cytochrome c-type biogenesis protein CcmH
LLLVVSLCWLLLGAGDTAARFDKLGHQMMCRCGCNQILLECNHVGCQYSETMRAELMAGLDRGDSDDLVLQGFVQKYGMTVLAAPTTTGFNRVAWVMPFLVLTVGLLLVVVVVRAWKSRALLPAAEKRSAGEIEAYRRRARQETEL